jgi:hypothetical protein
MHHSKRANGTEKSHRLRQVLINGQHVVDHASLRSPGFFWKAQWFWCLFKKSHGH